MDLSQTKSGEGELVPTWWISASQFLIRSLIMASQPQTVRGEDIRTHNLYRHDDLHAEHFKGIRQRGPRFPTEDVAAGRASPPSTSVGEIIGQSSALRLVLEQIERSLVLMPPSRTHLPMTSPK